MAGTVSFAVGSEAPDQYGVAGHPIGHSWSPFIHGMFAKATAQNLVYRLFDITAENFRGDALRLFAGGIKGLNITLPHKQAAAELVNELTPRAERAKAVNTIAFFDEASLLGDNTDGLGLTADLENNLGIALGDKRVLILGAGGAVRGVLGSLMERDLREVVIANRTPDRARKLATEFADLGAISGCGFSEVRGPPYDLIINATSASLQGEMPEMPPGLVGEDSICYDMAYGRGHTPFTLWAKSLHAARTTKGWGMLVEQAAESFLLWRGIRPDTAPVLEALARHA
jgi:shikimate dehydrogenase